jgi:hypothetical protein
MLTFNTKKMESLAWCVNPKNKHGLLDFYASILHMDPQTTEEQNGKILEYAWQLQETESWPQMEELFKISQPNVWRS